MAIKISGNTVIDDSQNITATGSATIDGPISLGSVALPSAGTARIYSRDIDNSLYLQTSSGNRISLLDGSQNSMASFEPTVLKFFISNTPVMRIDSSGNMGLGTESPSSLLHVSGQDATINVSAADGSLSAMTSNTSQRIAFQGGNTEIGLFKDSSDNYSYVIGTYQGSIDIPLVFRTGNRAERMRIDSSGRVLLGTTSNHGDEKLLVTGAASGVTGNAIFTLQRGSDAGNGDGLGQINFADARTSSNYAQIFGAVDGTPGANDFPGRLSFNTAADGASSPSERMRLDSSGNVKIGGTLPSAPNISLNADGSATFAASVECNTELRLIRSNGNRVNLGGSDTLAVFENNGNFAINWDGSASFDGTITANGGYALSQLTELT